MAAEQTIHLERYSPDAKALVASAQSLADDRKHAQVEPIHLLARVVERDGGAREVFRRAGAEPADAAATRTRAATMRRAIVKSGIKRLLERRRSNKAQS